MKTAKEMESQVIGRAAEDESFRTQLLDDPRGAIEHALGISLPESMTVHVHEESSTSAHLVLPPASKLSNADLQAVAGGIDLLFEPHKW